MLGIFQKSKIKIIVFYTDEGNNKQSLESHIADHSEIDEIFSKGRLLHENIVIPANRIIKIEFKR